MQPAPPSPYEPPPPPPQKPADGFSRPLLSFRIDPLSWLIDGRLPLEMEMQIWKFISVELVPVFVTSELSPSLNRSFDGNVTQHSNGIGALSGASIGLGFWVSGRPMRGTVLRAILTDYGYTYRSNFAGKQVDEVSHTDRHFYGFLGSNSTWGIFTVSGGFGLGVELNKERRCFPGNSVASATSDCAKDQQLIAVPDSTGRLGWADLHSFSYPIEAMVRLSLGVTF
jgi:hypothetical protein